MFIVFLCVCVCVCVFVNTHTHRNIQYDYHTLKPTLCSEGNYTVNEIIILKWRSVHNVPNILQT